MSAHIAAEIANWPTKAGMVSILRDAGLTVTVGSYSIRVKNCSHIVFEEYGGDFGRPTIAADADTLEEMIRDGHLVSAALARADVAHRFEVYDEQKRLSGYLHQTGHWKAPPGNPAHQISNVSSV
jgi:hypothetical protein